MPLCTAAESHVDRSITGPAAFIETNIVGTYVLLEAARAYWSTLDDVAKKAFRFHHISTDEVYGDLPHGRASGFYRSAALYRDHSLCAKQPVFCFKSLQRPSGSSGCVPMGSRPSSLTAPITTARIISLKLIPLVILNALEGKALPIYGKGDQIRDWLYVEDHARALYTVVTGVSRVKLTTLVVITRRKTSRWFIPFAICWMKLFRKGLLSRPDHVCCRSSADRRYAIDAHKIAAELGWKPAETFESGIRKTVEWYLNNKNGVFECRMEVINVSVWG